MGTDSKFVIDVERYFEGLRRVRASGGATGERSNYIPLAGLLNAIGATLSPKVFCVQEIADQGAGHPDFGLYAAKQVQRGEVRAGQTPERGVIEVKAANDDAWLTVESDQVSRYWSRYRQVVVTNCRDFIVLGEDATGRPARLESFRLAESADEFHRLLDKPRAFAREAGAGLGEYLVRALSHRATLVDPKDLAWLLASYAREGLVRVEAAGRVPSLSAIHTALEEALGVRFEGERGARFFHSTLVQTLFYGLFAAWVLWSRQTPMPAGVFDWRTAVWHLRAPVLRALFQQLSDPGRLQSLGLVEVLDWTAAALERVDRAAFFSRFDEGAAVPYFYEPFLEAFDPELRKQLGVWYTPSEVVRYMVARVDKALKDDLGITEGLAAENVYVLDPCCGTGAYLAEVLRRITSNLEGHGLGALVGERVKQAALERVFGFEIMPAPFVVAHLQVDLTLQNLNAPLVADGTERASIFLTNALTGWDSRTTKPTLFPELEEERDRAERVKREEPILVILGNPPYNGFAGVALEEEQDVLEAYRTSKQVELPDIRALHDLYVRFFRVAERRITENTGQGIVCFISNYSWLDGRSFAGMREHYMEVFDSIRIDCLNGDVRKGGRTPDGQPDPSIFTVPGGSVGIQVGTAIATLVRKAEHMPTDTIGFRHLWGKEKRNELMATTEEEPDALYDEVAPMVSLGLPFILEATSEDWFNWPSLTDLFPVQYSGINTNRDAFVIDIDLEALKSRVTDYFDSEISHEDIAKLHPSAMKIRARYNPEKVRDALLSRGGPNEAWFVRHAYRPFDLRWLYWEADTKLLNERRPKYRPHVIDGNLWLSASPHLRKHTTDPQAYITKWVASLHLIERGSNMFPMWLLDDGICTSDKSEKRRPNLSTDALRYVERLGLTVGDLFFHVLAVLHNPAYRADNAAALRMEWPRIPLPGWPDGANSDAAAQLARSAKWGRELADILDPETPVPGVTQAPLHRVAAAIAVPTTTDGRNMAGNDFELRGRWGRLGAGDAVMPGKGRTVERDYTTEEREILGETISVFGDTTFDIYLNSCAFWQNVPAAVWNYKLGGYQVLKKWLSYRESSILERPLLPNEVRHFTDTARRISVIC